MAETTTMEKSGALVSIKCAFRDGTGKNPFGIMSILAACQVCGGRGRVTATEPVVKCPFCNGRGTSKAASRATCPACKGKGIVPVVEPVDTCPSCKGKGKELGRKLPCRACKGSGVVTVKGEQQWSGKLHLRRN